MSSSPVQAQSSDPLKTKHQLDLERSYFLVTQAFEEDEKGNSEEAIELYTQAVELCIQAVSSVLQTPICLYLHFPFRAKHNSLLLRVSYKSLICSVYKK